MDTDLTRRGGVCVEETQGEDVERNVGSGCGRWQTGSRVEILWWTTLHALGFII